MMMLTTLVSFLRNTTEYHHSTTANKSLIRMPNHFIKIKREHTYITVNHNQLYKHAPFNRVISKPGYVLNGHLSRPAVTDRLKRPTRKHDGQPYHFLFGLASNGVYMCPPCYQRGGSLLHCPSTLTVSEELVLLTLAVYFCCTFLGVTSTGRYPASCPVKPGLSSPAAFRHLQPRPFFILELEL